MNSGPFGECGWPIGRSFIELSRRDGLISALEEGAEGRGRLFGEMRGGGGGAPLKRTASL